MTGHVSPISASSGQDVALARIADLVERGTGLTFRSVGGRAFELAVHERAAKHGCRNLSEYLDLLDGSDPPARASSPDAGGLAGELGELAERLFVHETSFFRQPAQFQALQAHLLPALHAALPAGEPLRLWSAGTASGEEAYSLAAVALAVVQRARPVEVLGTDLSRQSLERAGEARYPASKALPAIPNEFHGWAFRSCGGERGDCLEPTPLVRSAVRFARHNLAARPLLPPRQSGPFHVVLCRNVFIYFAPETTRRVLEELHRHLDRGGYLLVGHAEAMLDAATASISFEPVSLPGAYAYRRADPSASAASGSGRTAAVGRRRRTPTQGGERAEELLGSARRLADRGTIEDAVAEARGAAALEPSSAEAHHLVGTLAAQLGDLAGAAAALGRTVALRPEQPLPRVQLAGVLAQRGDRAAARRAYVEAADQLERLPPAQLVGEFAAGHLARLCRERAAEL